METFLGNSSGVIIGPYGDNEIGAQLHGKAILSQGGGFSDVYVIKARNLADAKVKLAHALRKEVK